MCCTSNKLCAFDNFRVEEVLYQHQLRYVASPPWEQTIHIHQGQISNSLEGLHTQCMDSLMLEDGNLTEDRTKEKSKLNFLHLHIPLFNMLFCTVYMKTKNKQKEL